MRFQTKFRRRREAKTDYHARKHLIIQDLNKYVSPKYRLVARITNSKVIAQIAYATLAHDKILAEANSKELRRYGLHNAFTSYSAAYATGLLLARRLLKTLKMDTIYPGVQKIDGNDYDVSTKVNENRRPFMAILDIGIRRPTTGNRAFAVMKGVCDGGVHVPHSVRKFPGYKKGKSKKDSTYDAALHRKRIYGGHIDDYMKSLQKEDQELFNKQFSQWANTLKREGAKSVEELFGRIFDQIRKDPNRIKSKKVRAPPVYVDSSKTYIRTAKGKYRRDRKLTKEDREARVKTKKELARNQLNQA